MVCAADFKIVILVKELENEEVVGEITKNLDLHPREEDGRPEENSYIDLVSKDVGVLALVTHTVDDGSCAL